MTSSAGAPFFSVVVPTYNHASYLPEALASVLAQTDGDFEVVVVDDGSTDRTPELLEEWSARDPRIRAFTKPNGGTATALNRALDEARGRWICWLSSDDLFEPEKLAIHREAIVRHPEHHFFHSLARTLDEETGRTTSPSPRWLPEAEPWQVLQQLRKNFVNGITICVERSAFLEIGGFDTSLRYGQDYDAWLKLLPDHPSVFVPERTCVSREHAGQGSRTFKEACIYDSARSAISFVNREPFARWFPGIEVSEPEVAREAFARALLLAQDEDAAVYRLGMHPGVVGRLLEWLASDCPSGLRPALQRELSTAAERTSRRLHGSAFGLLWKAVAIVASDASRPFDFLPVDAGEVGRAALREARAAGSKEAEPLARFLDMIGEAPSEVPEPTAPDPGREMCVWQPSQARSERIGADDALAQAIASGWQVLEVRGGSGPPLALTAHGVAIREPVDAAWKGVLARLWPFDGWEGPHAPSELASGLSTRWLARGRRLGDLLRHEVWKATEKRSRLRRADARW